MTRSILYYFETEDWQWLFWYSDICGRVVFFWHYILSMQKWQNFWDMGRTFTILRYISEPQDPW